MILITGASRGIGKFLLRKFKQEGEIVRGFFNITKPTEYAEIFCQLDITDEKSIIEFVRSEHTELKRIILINCAGINYNAVAHKSDTKKWVEVINTNLIGTFQMIKHILPLMRSENYGRIINLSSVLSQKGVPGTSAYSASKAALTGLAKCLAAENANRGITINNLNLGYFATGMIDQVPTIQQEFIKKTIPTGAYGNPENVYQAVKFLIQSDYTNGADININGGLL